MTIEGSQDFPRFQFQDFRRFFGLSVIKFLHHTTDLLFTSLYTKMKFFQRLLLSIKRLFSIQILKPSTTSQIDLVKILQRPNIKAKYCSVQILLQRPSTINYK